MQMTYYTVNRVVYAMLLWLWVMMPGSAQRIENIRPVAHHDTIVITYDLVGVPIGEKYKISAYVNNGNISDELRSIIGRTIVLQGRNELKWKVLEDLEEGLRGDSITFTLMAARLTGDAVETSKSTVADRRLALFDKVTSQIDSYLESLNDHNLMLHDFGLYPFESMSAYSNLLKQCEKMNTAYTYLLKNRRKFEAEVGMLWDEKTKSIIEDFFKTLIDKEHRHVRESYNGIYKQIVDIDRRTYQGSRRSKIEILAATIDVITKDVGLQIDPLKNQAKELYDQLKF